MTTPFICIGPSGVGKTLLLKRLQSSSVNEGTSTVETVRSNINQIPKKPPPPSQTDSTTKQGGGSSGGNVENTETSKPKDFLSVREIGGQMAPLWPSYYSPDKLVCVYIIISLRILCKLKIIFFYNIGNLCN